MHIKSPIYHQTNQQEKLQLLFFSKAIQGVSKLQPPPHSQHHQLEYESAEKKKKKDSEQVTILSFSQHG